MDANTLAILLTALAAILVQPLVTHLATRRAFKLGVSQFRQQWIGQLRDMISAFITEASQIAAERMRRENDTVRRATRKEAAMLLETKIRLMLNRHEEDHARLMKQLGELLEVCLKVTDETKPAAFTGRMEECVLLSQDVLKREWDRLKRGK